MKKKSSFEFLILSRLKGIYATQRLVQELTRQNRPFRVEDPEVLYLGHPDVILPRLGTWRFHETLRHLQGASENFKFVNTLSSYRQTRNKWLCLQTLSQKGLPTPLSELIHRHELSLLETPYPFIVKEICSSQGVGVGLIQGPQDLERFLIESPNEEFVVQEYIEECHGRDLRIFLTTQGDHWTIARTNTCGDFRSNLHQGGTPSAERATYEELQWAQSILKIFGLDYAGVDILRSHQGSLILEVNPCPGFEGIEKIYGPVVAPQLISLAENF